jgi:hypothetical protein
MRASMSESKADEDAGRRVFLKVLVGSGSAVFGCALAAPAALFVAAPATQAGAATGQR